MTALTKIVNGEEIDLTPAEVAEIEAEWSKNAAAALAGRAAADALAYREARKAAYVAELGLEPDLINTLGDVIDALIKAHYGAPADLDVMKTKIDAIKARFPKPQIPAT